MNRLNLLWIIAIILASFAFADQTCYVGEICPFQTIAKNTSSGYYNGTVTNSLRYYNGTYIYENQTMVNLGDGNYAYNYTFTETGSYWRKSFALTVKEDEVITVKEYYSKSTWEELTMLANNFVFWVQWLVVLGVALYKLYNVMNGFKFKDKSWIWISNIIGGLSFIIGGFYVMTNPAIMTNQAYLLESPFYVAIWVFTILELLYVNKEVAIDKDFAA